VEDVMSSTVSTLGTATRPSRALSIALWAVQLLLGAMFAMAGVLKSTRPIAELAPMIPWTPDVPEALVRFIGISELAGAIGLIVPAATRILPWLTPLAALGIAVIMLLATGFHIMRGEIANLPITLILGALAAFVAWGRSRKAPIAPRG
jgi:putative oxidoreductase